MSVTLYSQHYYHCETDNIEIYFEYNNSVVFDIGKEILVSDDGRPHKRKELLVITRCEQEQYSTMRTKIRY